LNFLHPFYFWVMLGLIPLIAVYFLKVRPRRKPTTAFFLWQKLFDQKRSTSLFQKLRDLLSLLLMLLAFVSIVLALTAPVLNNEQLKNMLIIIDNSASMSTKEKSGTRLDQAKSLAKDIIRSLNQNQQAAVAAMSLDIRYMSHFTASPRTLIDAVSQIEPSDCPFKEKILISSLAYRNISSDPNTDDTMSRMVSNDYRILLISDGCGIDGNLPDFVELFKVGAKCDNLGLIACDLQRIDAASMDGSTQKEQLELYYQIGSSADETIQTDLLVQYGPNRITKKLIPMEIQPGINKPEHYIITNDKSDESAVDPEQAGLWTVQIDYDDSLDKDNIAYLAVPPKHSIRVEVDSNDSYFLKHSILAFSQTSNDLVLVDSQPEIILTDGMPSRQGCSIVFSPDSSDGWWGSAGKPVEKILPHIIIKDHPLLEHCDIEAIPFVGAREVNLPEDSLVLVENEDQVPLIYRVRSEENSAVIVNMNLKDSDFYYSAWFPVIIYNAAKNLTGKSDRIASSYPIGSVVPVPLLRDSDSPLAVRYSWESITDSSTESKLLHNSESEISNNDSQFIIRKLGYYSISNTSGKVHVGSGLFNKSQTMVNNDIQDTSLAINRGMPPSFFLSIFALIVLLIESMLYHRRKAG
jgi:hypothetical protein